MYILPIIYSLPWFLVNEFTVAIKIHIISRRRFIHILIPNHYVNF